MMPWFLVAISGGAMAGAAVGTGSIALAIAGFWLTMAGVYGTLTVKP